MKTILEIGGEGGSITLIEINGKFRHSTQEFAMFDLLNEEDRIGIKFIPEDFDTFDLCISSLIKKYPIFELYPIVVKDTL